MAALEIKIRVPSIFYDLLLYCSRLVDKVEPSKKNTTMVKPFAGSSGVARGNEAKPSRYHLRDVVLEGSVEGFFLIM
jgi:hypothetical protein